MNPAIRMRSICALTGVMILLSGCFNPFHPQVTQNRGVSEPPPVPNSPINALRLFEWCWEQRSISEYEELFSDDFRFTFASTDSSGNAYQDRGFIREDEIESARHLFLGGPASQPAASQITLDFDPNLVPLPDNRPGKTQPWHQEIDTHVLLTISFVGTGGERVDGSARFFLVRGDSASIPTDLRNRGFGPDPNRWYIERYEEEDPFGTALAPSDPRARLMRLALRSALRSGGTSLGPSNEGASGSALTLPQGNVTWGWIKASYRWTYRGR